MKYKIDKKEKNGEVVEYFNDYRQPKIFECAKITVSKNRNKITDMIFAWAKKNSNA